MEEDELKHVFINPYYAINIDPSLATKHSPVVPKPQWIQANLHLIGEIGPEEWLERLLAVLQGDYPHNPDSDTPYAYHEKNDT